MKTRLRELLEHGGLGDKVLDALIKKAQDGDVPAIREILDRIDGKVSQDVQAEVTHRVIEYANGNPIQD